MMVTNTYRADPNADNLAAIYTATLYGQFKDGAHRVGRVATFPTRAEAEASARYPWFGDDALLWLVHTVGEDMPETIASYYRTT